MRHIEHEIQKAICKYLGYALPADATFWAVENGGTRKGGAREGARLKAQGVTAGVADLHILWAGRLICLEVKCPQGPANAKTYQSTAQKDWEALCVQSGGVYRVVRSVDDVKALVDMIGADKPKRLGVTA